MIDSGGHYPLKAVTSFGFLLKLHAFLDDHNTNPLFVVPDANITLECEDICREAGAKIVSLSDCKLSRTSLHELLNKKTILKVDPNKVGNLVELFFAPIETEDGSGSQTRHLVSIPNIRILLLFVILCSGLIASIYFFNKQSSTKTVQSILKPRHTDNTQKQILPENDKQDKKFKIAEGHNREKITVPQVIIDDQETKKREREEQKLREEADRQRVVRLEKLQALGVRGVPITSSATPPSDAMGVWVALRTVPDDAEVFLDWSLKGNTPLWLNGVEINGFLMVMKDGYRPWFRRSDFRESTDIPITLSVEEPYSPLQLLLVTNPNVPTNTIFILRAALGKAGFSFPGTEAMDEFRAIEHSAGGLTNPVFRAWTRTRFNTNFLVTANVLESQRDMSEQARELSGVVKSDVDVNLDIYALQSGLSIAQITASGSAFARNASQSFKGALIKAATSASQNLRAWADKS